jgi:hypothetical protein
MVFSYQNEASKLLKDQSSINHGSLSSIENSHDYQDPNKKFSNIVPKGQSNERAKNDLIYRFYPRGGSSHNSAHNSSESVHTSKNPNGSHGASSSNNFENSYQVRDGYALKKGQRGNYSIDGI